jgi:hypothetical protein
LVDSFFEGVFRRPFFGRARCAIPIHFVEPPEDFEGMAVGRNDSAPRPTFIETYRCFDSFFRSPLGFTLNSRHSYIRLECPEQAAIFLSFSLASAYVSRS